MSKGVKRCNMEQLEKVLKEVEEQGDLRRQAAQELQSALCAVCDRVGMSAQKAGIWGECEHVALQYDSKDDDARFVGAYLSKERIFVNQTTNPEERVIVRLARLNQWEDFDGSLVCDLQKDLAAWTMHKIARKEYRAFTNGSGILVPSSKTGDKIMINGESWVLDTDWEAKQREIKTTSYRSGDPESFGAFRYLPEDFKRPSRAMSVLFAKKIEAFVNTLLDRCEKLAQETQVALARVPKE
jgi:hypothetical protein